MQTIEKLNRQHSGESIAIVSHADLIKLVLAHYLGMHLDLFQRLVIAPASVSLIALAENGGVHIMRLNDTGPLQPPSIPPQAKQKQDEEK